MSEDPTARAAEPAPSPAAVTAPGGGPEAHHVRVHVQVAAGGFVKRTSRGDVDFVSPLPCPFNYGELPGTLGGDGDPLDAVVLGPRVPPGTSLRAALLGAVDFEDAGQPDLKLVCGNTPLRGVQRTLVLAWFRGYAVAKRALNVARGQSGPTRCRGWVDVDTARSRLAAAQARAAAAAGDSADEGARRPPHSDRSAPSARPRPDESGTS